MATTAMTTPVITAEDGLKLPIATPPTMEPNAMPR
jgi:hypothetical protein